jgi:sugar phosphate isomerase/epimerase
MPTPPSYRFGVSEFTTWPWSFEQDVERYAELGVDAIEVCEFKLDQARFDQQLALVGRHNLTISSVQPAVRTLFPSQSQPEPKSVPDRMARFQQTIERFGDLAAGVPFVTNTGIPPNGNIQEVMDTASRQYREVASGAADRGARVALEPLNASIMNVESAVWTLQQGMRVVEAVDRPNFGICLDAWNIWQNAHLTEAIRACGDRIFVVQLSDWRTPRSYQDRLIIGEGEIPLPPMLRAIHDAGYRGPYVVEIFSGDVSDSLWSSDLKRVIMDSRAGLDRAWHDAFSSYLSGDLPP